MMMIFRRARFGLAAAALTAALTGCGRPGDREFHAGLKELKAERWVEARTWMERSIARRPGSAANAPAYNYLGLACARLGDLPAAADAFEESRRLDPKRPEPVFNLADLRARGGDILEASALLNEAAALDPQSARAPEMLGHLYDTRQRWSDARAQYEEAMRRDPDSSRIRTALAVALYREGNAGAAVPHLAAVLDRAPDYAPAAYNLFVVYREGLNLPAPAEAWARRFLSLAGPDHPQTDGVAAWLKTREAERVTPPRRGSRTEATSPAESSLAEARAFAQSGTAGAALNACLKAAQQARMARNESLRERALALGVELAPDQPRAHMAQAQYLMEKNRTAEALASFRLATTLGPNLPEAHAGRGEAAIAERELDDALVSLRRALELDADHADARWRLAEIYDGRMDRPAEALQEYREFARRFTADPRSLRAKDRIRALETEIPPPSIPVGGHTLPKRDAEPPSLPRAGRSFDITPAARLDPGEAVKAFDRGRSFARQGAADRAIPQFRRSLELNPESAEVWFNLALALQQKGETDLALDAYRKGLDREPQNHTMRYNAALALQGLGRIPEARTQLEYLIRAQPTQANARYLLGMIEASSPGRAEQACAQLEEFLRLAPQDPNAASVRSWLQTNR
ncbi:MAG: tetratricopeptide repeat protein [Kiritimatiellae bacterium]|nr:tetratricopeptide repeat protein [Kiritimatiellia bacterium]